jgi:hypothetical protein
MHRDKRLGERLAHQICRKFGARDAYSQKPEDITTPRPVKGAKRFGIALARPPQEISVVEVHTGAHSWKRRSHPRICDRPSIRGEAEPPIRARYRPHDGARKPKADLCRFRKTEDELGVVATTLDTSALGEHGQTTRPTRM